VIEKKKEASFSKGKPELLCQGTPGSPSETERPRNKVRRSRKARGDLRRKRNAAPVGLREGKGGGVLLSPHKEFTIDKKSSTDIRGTITGVRKKRLKACGREGRVFGPSKDESNVQRRPAPVWGEVNRLKEGRFPTLDTAGDIKGTEGEEEACSSIPQRGRPFRKKKEQIRKKGRA